MRLAPWHQWLQTVWYGESRAYILLLPLSWLYCGLVSLRRLVYRAGVLATRRLASPVIVVGNISVGGTGKTPLVIALAERLQRTGYKVGILTRGYLGAASCWPQAVEAYSDPRQVGDEAVVLAQRTGAPVFAGPRRVAAGRALLQTIACDVLICDDGLQHYALQHDIEIAMMDATRANGNGRCLPAGPLREPISRLRQVDAAVSVRGNSAQAYGMQLVPAAARRLSDPADRRELATFLGRRVHAVAGIGNPQRFFTTLQRAGLALQKHPFPDHHPFRAADLAFGDDRPVLMTEKDAVKCQGFSQANRWVVPVEARVDEAFYNWLLKVLDKACGDRLP